MSYLSIYLLYLLLYNIWSYVYLARFTDWHLFSKVIYTDIDFANSTRTIFFFLSLFVASVHLYYCMCVSFLLLLFHSFNNIYATVTKARLLFLRHSFWGLHSTNNVTMRDFKIIERSLWDKSTSICGNSLHASIIICTISPKLTLRAISSQMCTSNVSLTVLFVRILYRVIFTSIRQMWYYYNLTIFIVVSEMDVLSLGHVLKINPFPC